MFQEEQLHVCQERVAVFVALLQWEHAEKKTKVTETHAALLKLQTLITAELHTSDVTHAIHTHRLVRRTHTHTHTLYAHLCVCSNISNVFPLGYHVSSVCV